MASLGDNSYIPSIVNAIATQQVLASAFVSLLKNRNIDSTYIIYIYIYIYILYMYIYIYISVH